MPFPNKKTQFKKGVSGNPKGRPKGSKAKHNQLSDLIKNEDWFEYNIPIKFIKEFCKDKKRITEQDAFDCMDLFYEKLTGGE